jgi:hypothetical protein
MRELLSAAALGVLEWLPESEEQSQDRWLRPTDGTAGSIHSRGMDPDENFVVLRGGLVQSRIPTTSGEPFSLRTAAFHAVVA